MKSGDFVGTVGLYAPNQLVVQALSFLVEELGLEHRTVEDPADWATTHPGRLLLLGDPPFEKVASILDAGFVHAVVVTDTQPVALHAAAGGFPVLSTSARAGHLAVALEAVGVGMRVVPPDRIPPTPYRALEEDDWNLLIALVTYSTAARIGEAWFRSESSVRRRLRRLYERLGVEGREEALYLAGRYGVVADPLVAPPRAM